MTLDTHQHFRSAARRVGRPWRGEIRECEVLDLYWVEGKRPPTMNRLLRSAGAGGRARYGIVAETARLRGWAEGVCRGLGPVAMVGVARVVAWPMHRDGRSPQDAGACLPSVKAVVDGCVDAGVLTGDGPDAVVSVTLRAPVVVGVDGLRVRIVELPGSRWEHEEWDDDVYESLGQDRT